MPDILDELADLQHQAITEKSHYYVGRVVQDARVEIIRLRVAVGQAELRYGNLLAKQSQQ